MILILQASSPGVGESGMIYEICTYNVKENRLDEFEVLARNFGNITVPAKACARPPISGRRVRRRKER